MNSVHVCPTCFPKNSVILPFCLRIDLPSGLYPSGFSNKIVYIFKFHVRATCPARLFLFDLITLILHSESLQVTQLLSMHSSPASRHFLAHRVNIIIIIIIEQERAQYVEIISTHVRYMVKMFAPSPCLSLFETRYTGLSYNL